MPAIKRRERPNTFGFFSSAVTLVLDRPSIVLGAAALVLNENASDGRAWHVATAVESGVIVLDAAVSTGGLRYTVARSADGFGPGATTSVLNSFMIGKILESKPPV